MKQSFLYLLSVTTLMLAACQRDEIVPATESQPADIVIEAHIPATGFQVRSGEGMSINRCVLEIYHAGTLYSRTIREVVSGDVSFDLRLVSSQEYDLLFWADNVANSQTEAGLARDNKYKTSDGLLAVTYNSSYYYGNQEAYDAFFAHEKLNVSGAFNKSVTLKRPFGQLNVKTTDINDITLSTLQPNKASIAFVAVPQTFNLMTGEAGNPQPLQYISPANAVDAAADANGVRQLTCDYIFAPETGSVLIDFQMNFINTGSTVFASNDGFRNIPIQRNYRTNVSGNLVTKRGTISVTVSPSFDDPNTEYVVAEEPTPAGVAEKMLDGATVGKITEPVSDGSPLDLTQIVSNDNGIAADTPLELHFTQGVHSSTPDVQTEVILPEAYTGTLTVYVPADDQHASTMKITAPNATVSIKGTYEGVDLASGSHTGIVEATGSVSALRVLKGNIEVRGTVGTLTIDAAADTEWVRICGTGKVATMTDETGKVSVTSVWDGTSLTEIAQTTVDKQKVYQVRYAPELAWIFAKAKTGDITLFNDLDLDNCPWTPHKSYSGTFDGAGHTIRNLFIDKLGTQQTGFLGYAGNATVKNLTFLGGSVSGGQYSAVVCGSNYASMDNVTVDGFTLSGNDWKIGGLVGQWNEGNSCLANCTVRNTTISIVGTSTADYCGGLAGFANYSSTSGVVRAKNCTVENVTISAASGKYNATTSAAVGCVMPRNGNNPYTFSLENITLTNVTLPETTTGDKRVCDYVGGFDWRGPVTGFMITYNGATVYEKQ